MSVISGINVIADAVPSPVPGVAPRYTYEEFEVAPTAIKSDGKTAASGTTGDTNLLTFERTRFEYHIKGTQTINVPTFSASGLDIGMDQTDNDGVELSQGITARSKAAFVAGTDSFFFRVQFSIEDVSGTDDCAIGFRTAEAYQANFDDYNNAVCLNVISGDIKIETILNNAATATTDTTDNWADGETHTLEVIVNKDRTVTFKIDGVAPTVTAAYTCDSGDVLVPFFFFLHASDVAGVVNIKSWECGLIN